MIWNYWLLNTLANALNFLRSLLRHLVRSTQNLVHPFEFLSPQSDLALDRKPLLFFNLFELVGFDHDLTIQLVNLRVDNFVRYRFNRPHLHLAGLNVKQLRKLIVAEVRFL